MLWATPRLVSFREQLYPAQLHTNLSSAQLHEDTAVLSAPLMNLHLPAIMLDLLKVQEIGLVQKSDRINSDCSPQINGKKMIRPREITVSLIFKLTKRKIVLV